MGRNGYLPLLVEETRTISISKLKEFGYLNEGCIRSGTLSWHKNGEMVSSIGLRVCFVGYERRIELNYHCRDIEFFYSVQLVSRQSNLGNGLLWFFECPQTGLLCRKLYFKDCRFYHRKAFDEFYYQKQVYSHRDRYLIQHFDAAHCEDSYRTVSKKYFKKTYRGKPTKKYLKAMRKIRIAERYSVRDIDRMIMGVF